MKSMHHQNRKSGKFSKIGVAVVILTGMVFWSFSACTSDAGATSKPKSERTVIEDGKYMVMVGGCNDCHTIGFAETGGNVPESEWLTGSPVGFRGPWGTTFPANLRLTVAKMTEDQWVEMCQTRQALPPMPWPSLNKMDESDIRAIYQFIKSLEVKGDVAPAYVQPDQEPQFPYFEFVPKHLERLGASEHK